MTDISTHPIGSKILSQTAAKELVDGYVSDIFQARTLQAGSISSDYKALWEAMAALYGAGGKRIRPYMMMLTYQAFGGSHIEDIVPAAAAQELLHQSLLIHDDIIDRDLVRYGVRNITGRFSDTYSELVSDDSERQHYAEGAAILAGDLLLSESHAQIMRVALPIEQIMAAQHIHANAVFHVAGGELLDVEAAFRSKDVVDPLVIATNKTAVYSFVSPLVMGATLAGVPEEQITLLTDIGTTLGIAYQLRDDIIGIFGDEQVTGKSTTRDIYEGKKTMLLEEFYVRSSADQQAEFEKVFGIATASLDDIEKARGLLVDTGTLQAVEDAIKSYKAQCLEQLSKLSINEQYRQAFVGLINISLDRIK